VRATEQRATISLSPHKDLVDPLSTLLIVVSIYLVEELVPRALYS
jgi:hypothetical protein